MSERDKAINFEVYQLVCDLKLKLLQMGSRGMTEEEHSSILRLLVAMKKYCKFFKLTSIYKISEDMEMQWRSIDPGDSKDHVVDSLLTTATKLSSKLSPHVQ